jgi:hypothetical protein
MGGEVGQKRAAGKQKLTKAQKKRKYGGGFKKRVRSSAMRFDLR